MDLRLSLVDIESSAPEVAPGQRFRQGPLVHDRAAGDVDQDGLLFHQPQLFPRKQMTGRRIQGGVDRNDVRCSEELVEREPGHLKILFLRCGPAAGVGIDNVHPEGAGPQGHRPADPAQADDAQPFARNLAAQEEVELPAPEAPFPSIPIGLWDFACHGQNQCPGQVGRGLGQDSRRVGHEDAPFVRGRKVDVVVADGAVGDDPQARCRVDDLPVDLIDQEAEKSVLIPDFFLHLLPAHPPGAAAALDFGVFFQES